MRILVAEDHRDIAQLFQTVLELDGHDVIVVVSGFDELLDPQAWESVDGALLDYWLEDGANGLDLATAAKSAGVDVVCLITATDAYLWLQDTEFRVIKKPSTVEEIRDPFRVRQ